jgi:hypothetical protein
MGSHDLDTICIRKKQEHLYKGPESQFLLEVVACHNLTPIVHESPGNVERPLRKISGWRQLQPLSFMTSCLMLLVYIECVKFRDDTGSKQYSSTYMSMSGHMLLSERPFWVVRGHAL